MNLYLLYTDRGNVYAVKASYSFEAVRKVEKLTGEHVNAWDVSCGPLPPACKWIPELVR